MSFKKLGVEAARQTKKPFEVLQLPLDHKRQIVTDLLEEFGTNILEDRDHEIRFHCNLPFGNHAHGDTTGKAHINYDKMTMHCWVCGGGGFLWWVSTMQGGSDSQVREWLAERTGIGGVQETASLLQFLDSIMNATPEVRTKTMPRYDPRVLDQWAFIHPYLTDFRRIPAQNVIDSRVGFGNISVRIGDSQFVQSPRIVIPHFWKGELVGWQSRRLSDDGTPKYVSTPEMPKDFTLYNYDATAPATVVVEAPISVVAQRHNVHMEATFGANVTDHQLDLLAQHTGDILLWMDNDPAGWNSMEQMSQYLSQRTSRLFVVDCPYAADPADLSSKDFATGLAEWRTPWVLWRRPSSLLEYRRTDVE